MDIRLKIMVAACLVCGMVSAEARVWNVRDYGAKGDGVAKDTAAVQRAVDACAGAGGGEVLLPKGTYLSGSVFLKSGVDFHLAEGAALKGSPDPADYNALDVAPQNWGRLGSGDNISGGHLVLCIEQKNVTLRGPGKIDGNVKAFLKMPDGSHPANKLKIPWRPAQMVWFVESKGITIRDIELADAPYWSCFVYGCEDVQVSNAYIHTVRQPHTYNGDGLDIDSSRRVRVTGCRIFTADDSITLRAAGLNHLKNDGPCADVTVSNCTFSSDCNAIRLGVGNGVVKDCSFTDIRIEKTRYAVNAVGAWSRPEPGVDISNISFRDMTIDAKGFCKFYYKFATKSVFDGITFSHVRGTVREPSIFDDKPTRPFRNLRFDDVKLEGETSPRVLGPLKLRSAFTRAPLGAIRPKGWILDRARAARDGYTGHMDDVSHHFRRAWSADWKPRGVNLNWGNDEKGSWSSEGGTYWFDGLVHLAWQMDDPYLKDLAKKRLEPILANMHANAVGTLWWMDRRDPKQMEEFFGPGAWQSRWVLGMRERALAAFYEATGDARAKQAIEWAYGNEEIARRAGWGATFAAGCIDVARVTGSAKVRACAEIAVAELKKNSQYAKPPAPWLPETLWTRRRAQNALKMPTRHGVFCAEQLLGVWRAWQLTGDVSLRDAVLAWYAFLDKNCHQPYGLTMMDEEWGWSGAKRGTETCDVAAEAFTRINILAGTGDGKWGDDVERVQFNAAPACVSRDFKRHVYFQLPNRAGLPGEAKELSCPYDSQCEYRESKQWPLCCVAALNKVLPNYIQAMWMKTEDGGVAATAYGPCTFEAKLAGGRAAFTEKTAYPFSETVEIVVEDAPRAAFPLLVRLPGWCERPSVELNGKALAVKAERGFARIAREWKKGDVVRLTFPMKPRVEIVRDMNDMGKRRAVVSFGPLLMAYAYPAKDDNTIIGDAAEPMLDPASVPGAQVVRTAMPSVWDWPLDAPVKLVAKDAAGKPLTLVPYGCTKLRVSMFPVD